MRTILIALLMTLTAQLAAAETVRAVTDDGRIVILDLKSMTWEFKKNALPKQDILFQNELLSISFDGLFEEEK